MKRTLIVVAGVFFSFVCVNAGFAQEINGFNAAGLELMLSRSLSVAPALTTDPDPLTDLKDYAGLAIHTAVNETKACGLFYTDPRQANLPWPRVPADKAVVNGYGQLLAYYHAAVTAHGKMYFFYNPDGSYQHDIYVSANEIRFRTPYNGLIARAKMQVVDDQSVTTYECGATAVDEGAFRQCISVHWSHLISRQLCRYGS